MFLTHKMTFDIICTGIHSFILFSLFAFNICQSKHHLDTRQSRVSWGQSSSKPSHHSYQPSALHYLSSANMNKFHKRWNVFLFSMSSGWELLWEWKWTGTGTDILHSLALLVLRKGQCENIKIESWGSLLVLGLIIHSESSFWLTIFISRFFRMGNMYKFHLNIYSFYIPPHISQIFPNLQIRFVLEIAEFIENSHFYLFR